MEVEKTGSINKAAANLYMTQSALSLSILSLERELGRHIFSRTNKGVAITPFGKTLLQYLRPIQDQIEQVNKIFVQGRRRENMIFTFANDGFTCGSLLCGILYQKYRPIGLRIEYYDGAGDRSFLWPVRPACAGLPEAGLRAAPDEAYKIVEERLKILGCIVAKIVCQLFRVKLHGEHRQVFVLIRLYDSSRRAGRNPKPPAPGGPDVSPSRYGEEPLNSSVKTDPSRDLYEEKLLRAFLKEEKPIFGICRGCQFLNVAFGGSLHQDLPPEDGWDHRDRAVRHKIIALEDSIVGRLFGTEFFYGAVERLLAVSAGGNVRPSRHQKPIAQAGEQLRL